MLALMLSITKSAASVVDGINYKQRGLYSSEVTVVALPLPGRWYTGSIVIPETVVIGGVTFSVTGIGTQAFVGCSSLKEVIIPNSVRNIGVQAFQQLYSIKGHLQLCNPAAGDKGKSVLKLQCDAPCFCRMQSGI